jgi:hypothetical protein
MCKFPCACQGSCCKKCAGKWKNGNDTVTCPFCRREFTDGMFRDEGLEPPPTIPVNERRQNEV